MWATLGSTTTKIHKTIQKPNKSGENFHKFPPQTFYVVYNIYSAQR